MITKRKIILQYSFLRKEFSLLVTDSRKMRAQPEDTNMQRPQTTANGHLVTHVHLILSLKSRENDNSCN